MVKPFVAITAAMAPKKLNSEASLKLNRKFTGIELEENYFQASEIRLNKYKHKQSKWINFFIKKPSYKLIIRIHPAEHLGSVPSREPLIKIISDSTTDEVLGVHMIAPRAADLIMEAVVAMEYRASAEDIARICHPHPTYSEALKEAALGATGNRALHV